MKRGFTAVCECETNAPPKKTMQQANTKFPQLILQLVLPHIMNLLQTPPAEPECPSRTFRTYLALNHTCRKLRYWNRLRRWVAWLLPTKLYNRFSLHSIVGCIPLEELQRVEMKLCNLWVTKERELQQYCKIWRIHNYFERIDHYFEGNFRGFGFFNIFGIKGRDKHTLCFVAPSFAEMVLFCHVIVSASRPGCHSFITMPGWRCKAGDEIYFTEKGKSIYTNKHLFDDLKRIGITAPIDSGFAIGSLHHTYFSLFCKIDGEHGTKKDKLAKFVRLAFPDYLIPSTEQQRIDDFDRFTIQFE